MVRVAPMIAHDLMNGVAACPPRTIAIGDIHGCAETLRRLLANIAPTSADTIVTLGDYVDRGPDSQGVLETLIQLRGKCRLVPLLGNHEQMLFSAHASRAMSKHWQAYGGRETLASYGPGGIASVPASHWAFLESCRLCFETETHFFAHANYDPQRPLRQQSEETMLSVSLNDVLPAPHVSGKIAVLGHTPQPGGQILDLGYLKCIDTDCWNGGLLTALDVTSGQVWQVRGPAPTAPRQEALSARFRSAVSPPAARMLEQATAASGPARFSGPIAATTGSLRPIPKTVV